MCIYSRSDSCIFNFKLRENKTKEGRPTEANRFRAVYHWAFISALNMACLSFYVLFCKKTWQQQKFVLPLALLQLFIQGDSSALRSGLVDLDVRLPNSASADGSSAEATWQLSNMIIIPNPHQCNPGLRADETLCMTTSMYTMWMSCTMLRTSHVLISHCSLYKSRLASTHRSSLASQH